jgi:hypothetical protein
MNLRSGIEADPFAVRWASDERKREPGAMAAGSVTFAVRAARIPAWLHG